MIAQNVSRKQKLPGHRLCDVCGVDCVVVRVRRVVRLLYQSEKLPHHEGVEAVVTNKSILLKTKIVLFVAVISVFACSKNFSSIQQISLTVKKYKIKLQQQTDQSERVLYHSNEVDYYLEEVDAEKGQVVSAGQPVQVKSVEVPLTSDAG